MVEATLCPAVQSNTFFAHQRGSSVCAPGRRLGRAAGQKTLFITERPTGSIASLESAPYLSPVERLWEFMYEHVTHNKSHAFRDAALEFLTGTVSRRGKEFVRLSDRRLPRHKPRRFLGSTQAKYITHNKYNI